MQAISIPARPLLVAVLSLAGCAFPTQIKQPAAPPPISPQTARPINVEVVDQRPHEERIADQNHADGFVYTTYDAPLQAKAFGDGMAGPLQAGRAIPGYRNLNAKHEPAPNALTFRFTLQHWYAKWPIEPKQQLVLVEGECETSLEILAGARVIHSSHYASKGIPQDALVTNMSGKDYAKYITLSIDMKADNVHVDVIGAFYDDMRAHWAEIVAAEKGL